MRLKLTPQGLVVYDKATCTTFRFNPEETRKLGYTKLPSDTTPEVVHLEVSDRCNLNCSYCYVEKKGEELSTEQWKKVIQDLSQNGIFQITFGGGEPFIRDDLIELARFANGKGLNVAVTTNGTLLDKFSDLSAFRQINISYHRKIDIMEQALSLLRKKGVRAGINFLLSREYETFLSTAAELAKEFESELLLLMYKPVRGDWENQISAREMITIARELSKSVPVAVDSMVLRHCYANDRFCDISSTGELFPCSFVRTSQGNVVEHDFATVWRYRNRARVICPYEVK